MYTFSPLASIPADHGGFILVCVFAFMGLIGILIAERESFFQYFFAATVVLGFAYCVSFVWTDQSVKTFPNTPVVAEFVSFNAEGYNETRKSGKQTTHVDVHETYVTYKVNGNLVMLRSQVGVEYPKMATLYKN